MQLKKLNTVYNLFYIQARFPMTGLGSRISIKYFMGGI